MIIIIIKKNIYNKSYGDPKKIWPLPNDLLQTTCPLPVSFHFLVAFMLQWRVHLLSLRAQEERPTGEINNGGEKKCCILKQRYCPAKRNKRKEMW